MISIDELIDEVDKNGSVIATHPKSHLKERPFLHNVSLVMPMAAGNKFLITRRAKNKYPYPNTWVCGCGGHARSGETPEETAKREMLEELGKNYPLKKVASFIYDADKTIFTIFTTTVSVVPAEFNFDPDEIQYSKVFSLKEITDMISKKPEEFAPTFIAAMKEFEKHYL